MLVTTDLNGDGFEDLAVANRAGDSITRLINDGSGSFSSPGAIALLSGPSAVAAADFDRTGDVDLVVARSSSSALTYLASTSADFAVIDLAGVTPATGPAAGGNSVTIRFRNTTTANAITFGGVPATITGNTTNTVTVTAPPHAAGLVDIAFSGPEWSGSARCAYKYLDPPPAPSTVNTQTLSDTSIFITWQAVPDAVNYELHRKDAGGDFTPIVVTSSTAHVDNALGPDTAHLYRVRVINAGGTSPDSAPVLGTTVVFTDNDLAGIAVKAVHLQELRTAVNAVRDLAGLPALTFAAPAVAGKSIEAADLTGLRTGLSAALSALSLPGAVFTDETLAGVIIKSVHFDELRLAAGK